MTDDKDHYDQNGSDDGDDDHYDDNNNNVWISTA